MKLNIGCGTDIKEGFINLDFIKEKGVDIIHDLNKVPYPFRDNTFNYIYASNILEHLTLSIFLILKELTRISKDKAIIEIIVPHYTSGGCFSESHTRFFSYNGLVIYKTKSLERIKNYADITKKQTTILFDKKLFFNYLIEPIMNKIPRVYENTFLKYLFPASEYRFMLEVTKKKLDSSRTRK